MGKFVVITEYKYYEGIHVKIAKLSQLFTFDPLTSNTNSIFNTILLL